jgi:TolB-like protein
MPIVPGTRVGPYAIVSPLGAGGMGEVYRARDTRLQRDVALKTLPAAEAADPERVERFYREARAVAALTHPNIVTIHSVEEADGVHFLTMELVEGRSLDCDAPSSGYSLTMLLQIGIPLADALCVAHERGIIHRDLKPANVILDGRGQVKVLDFGLAKFIDPPDAERARRAGAGLSLAETRAPLTRAGLIVGTMPYMAPEQIEGRRIDARADIFSLGVLLYELATGKRPFGGDSSPTVIASILRDTPAPVIDARPDLPGALGRLIARCLEKDPNDRIQTARDVLNELKSLQRESTTALTPLAIVPSASRRDPGSGSMRPAGFWTAVLPFTTRGTDTESLALAEGLTEDINAGLAKFPYVRVAARSDDARYVVEGAVRRVGSMMRVSVELKDLRAGVQLWGDKYDRDLTGANLFGLQDDLAARVIANVGANNGVLVLSMAAGLRDRPLADLSLDELVLRSLAFAFQQQRDENVALCAAFEAALSRDPSHAQGWARLASLYRAARLHLGTSVTDASDRHRRAGQRAVALDPACQDGWESLAFAHFLRRDGAAFRAAAERAIAINPLNTNVVAFLSHLIGYSGDWARGLDLLQRVMALGTQHPGWYHFLPFVNHFRLGQFDHAWAAATSVNMPDYPWTLLSLAATAIELGRDDDARKAIAAMRTHAPEYLNLAVARSEWDVMVWDAALVERFMHAYGRAIALDAPGTPVATRPASSIGDRPAALAVLPFANLSGDLENDYFGDGLAEEILNALTNVHGLTVIARTSAFAFKGKTGDVRQIGEALGVTAVLEGSVRRSGSRVRVTAQCVNTATGAQLWSQRYDREMTDIFAVQDDIAQAIVVALRGTFAPAPVRHYTPAVPAYEALLKGRAQLVRFTPDAWQRARAYFDDAIALDPGYADPHAELALGYFICGMHGMSPMREVAPFVRAAATRALALDPSNMQPRVVLGGLVLAHDYDWDAAREHFAASMHGPNVPAHARWIYGSLYLHALGRFEESSAEMARAVEQDPLNATWHGILAAHLAYAGRSDQAFAAVMRARELEPNYYVPLHMLGNVLEAAGRHAEAIDAYQGAHALAPWFAINAGCLAAELRRAGRHEDADRVLTEMGPTPRPMFGRVLYDLRVGAIDAAADSYERMIGERDPFALVFASSPNTRPLRAHPRWPSLAGMMNLPAAAR